MWARVHLVPVLTVFVSWISLYILQLSTMQPFIHRSSLQTRPLPPLRARRRSLFVLTPTPLSAHPLQSFCRQGTFNSYLSSAGLCVWVRARVFCRELSRWRTTTNRTSRLCRRSGTSPPDCGSTPSGLQLQRAAGEEEGGRIKTEWLFYRERKCLYLWKNSESN